MTGQDRRALLAGLATLLAVAVACSVWFGFRAHELREGPSGGNLALADPEATQEVTTQVSTSLRAVFSYDYTNLERAERAAEVGLTGAAATEYAEEFDDAADRAERDKLVRVSTVRSIGVQRLSGEEATLLVFLDQQTLREEGAPKSSTATLGITAVHEAGSWLISDIDHY